jgi:tetratricopeptide (TPR) repeat protein
MIARYVGLLLLFAALIVPAGCQTDPLFHHRKVPPGPMTDLESPMIVTAAEGTDQQEIALVEQVVMHRALYARYLRALQEFYRDLPNQTKRVWAEKEYADLAQVPPYRYLTAAEIGAAEVSPIQEKGIPIVDQQEVDLLEKLCSHRALYDRSLKHLMEHYEQAGDAQKLSWAETEFAWQQRIKPYRYILQAEVPPPDLRPTQSIAEADAMFEDALDLMKRGGHGTIALYRQELMRRALKKFQRLIDLYPTSDKIDESAFYCGEILKEYFKDDEPIAVLWYQRAIDWNPKIELPARFQAAVILDFRLHDRASALEMYQGCLDHERWLHKSNLRFAAHRVEQLTKESENPLAPHTEPGMAAE